MKTISLMYHDIVLENDKSSGFQNDSAFQYKVLKGNFEKQVSALKSDDVEFTFDDGGESFLTVAAPILESNGRRGVFFIATDYIGTPGFLNEAQLRELDNRGHIIGSHSCSHPHNMTDLSELDIEKEWKESVGKLEKILGHKVKAASIPNGYSNMCVLKSAESAGITTLWTSSLRDSKFGNMELKGRYVIHKDTSLQDTVAIVESKCTRFVLKCRWMILCAIKGILGNSYDNVKKNIVK